MQFGKSDLEAWIYRLLEGVRQGHPIDGCRYLEQDMMYLGQGYGYQTLEHHPSLVEGNFRSIETHVVTLHETKRKNAPPGRKRCE
jgi:hypothetical protein